jgi:hypothetical protein
MLINRLSSHEIKESNAFCNKKKGSRLAPSLYLHDHRDNYLYSIVWRTNLNCSKHNKKNFCKEFFVTNRLIRVTSDCLFVINGIQDSANISGSRCAKVFDEILFRKKILF